MGIASLSVLDGRYQRQTGVLSDVFSEYGLMRHRVFVEIQWLKFLLAELKFDAADASVMAKLDAIYDAFDADRALDIKAIEKETNHDVKAVEYYIKGELSASGLDRIKEWVHFACTSEDINNTAYALMLNEGRRLLIDQLHEVLERIEFFGREHKAVPMMSRTHGQPATPTTVGKEFINFAWRIRLETDKLSSVVIQAKMNGASGNYNAHHFVYPEIDWIDASRRFIGEYLGLAPLIYTTQINPYHYIAELLHVLIRIAGVFIDLDRDMWGYISLGYLKQKTKAGEVGSSTMPHKVNPIDFENSEGNMGLAISMMEHVAVKLLQSRFQRDLSDSTVLRNIGALFGYVLIGLKSTLKGVNKIEVDAGAMADDLDENLALLAEPIQTVLRVFDEPEPYEKLKSLTRGKKISRADLDAFLDALETLPEDVRQRLRHMSAGQYTGIAERLVDQYFKEFQ